MKVRLTYHDFESLTKEEVVNQAKAYYGEAVEVEVFPSSNDPWDHVYFAIQQGYTSEQLGLLFDAGALYPEKVAALKAVILEKLKHELNSVIQDNEARVK